MRISLFISIILFFIGIANASEVMDFEFQNSDGIVFQSTTILNQLEQRNNYRYDNINIILIETPSLNHKNYLEQMEILNSMAHGEAEDLQLIYVISCSKEEYKDGYHTSIQTAKKLTNQNESFRVRILDGKGNVYKSFNDPISVEFIRNFFREKNK